MPLPGCVVVVGGTARARVGARAVLPIRTGGGLIQLLMRYFDASSPVNWHAPASPAFQPDF